MQNAESEDTPLRQPNLNVVVPDVVDLCDSSSDDELVEKASAAKKAVHQSLHIHRQGDITSRPAVKPISATLVVSPKPHDTSHVRHVSASKSAASISPPNAGFSQASTSAIAIRPSFSPQTPRGSVLTQTRQHRSPQSNGAVFKAARLHST